MYTLLENFTLVEKKKINDFLSVNSYLKDICNYLSSREEKILLYKLVLIDQAKIIFDGFKNVKEDLLKIEKIFSSLKEIDDFYSPIGGIIGYHKKFLNLLKKEKGKNENEESFYRPPYIDISNKNDPFLKKTIEQGLFSLPDMAEIYPLGGSGDRLNLIDEKTKIPLPQAKLKFLKKSLIEHMILDLKAREKLYFEKYNKKIETPIVIMTSDAKNNHNYILEIFRENNYFGRKKENFFFIKQLSMPVIDEKGNWVLKEKLELFLKPGGHGMIWNTMAKKKVFDWLFNKNRKYAIIRQINNLVAGEDYNLLSFAGAGILKKKKFGFFSCPRVVKSAEGMLVLKEKKEKDNFLYNIGNIEYTAFKEYGILDEPEDKSTNYSIYPSNTNVLFVDLKEADKKSKNAPLFGIIINLKNKYVKDGIEYNMGRLELLMQNIADDFKDVFKEQIDEKKVKESSTFIVHNIRRKAISAIKNAYKNKENLLETPYGAFFDVQKNYRDILENYCQLKLPKDVDISSFVEKGPSFISYLNPLIGPLYEDFKEKVSVGEIKKGSLFYIDAFNIKISNFLLDGALHIKDKNLSYETPSTCILENVKIKNLSYGEISIEDIWSGRFENNQVMQIVLNENSFFIAKDVVFEGYFYIDVPANTKIIAKMEGEKIIFEKEMI